MAQFLAKAIGSLEALSLVGANRDAHLSFWHSPSAFGFKSKQSQLHLGVSNLSEYFTWLTASD